MLFVRVNGKDRAIPNAHGLRLIDIANNVRDALSADQREQQLAANARAVADAAQAGDIKRMQRLARRLTRK